MSTLESKSPYLQPATTSRTPSPSSSREPSQEPDVEPEKTEIKETFLEISQITPAADPAQFTTYIVTNATLLNLHLTTPGSRTPAFYSAHSNWTPGTPDVVLHSGPEKDGPVLGVVKLNKFHSIDTVGLGDPSIAVGENAVVWEDLKCTSLWKHKTYTFQWGGTTYLWRRTAQRMRSTPDMELVLDGQGERGEVWARHKASGVFRFKNRGVFEVRNVEDERLRLMIMLTALAILEVSRRRTRQRRY